MSQRSTTERVRSEIQSQTGQIVRRKSVSISCLVQDRISGPPDVRNGFRKTWRGLQRQYRRDQPLQTDSEKPVTVREGRISQSPRHPCVLESRDWVGHPTGPSLVGVTRGVPPGPLPSTRVTRREGWEGCFLKRDEVRHLSHLGLSFTYKKKRVVHPDSKVIEM